MEDCIFCKIVKGEIPSYKVYEDERVYAFLDINPLSEGHTLLLPKEHYVNILDIPAELYVYMNEIVKKIADRVQLKYAPDGILINQNNGRRAGQEVDHMHIHIKPVYEDTKIFNESKYRKRFSGEKMKEIRSDLSLN